MLMKRFYSNLLTPVNKYAEKTSGTDWAMKATALREAKIWLRNYIDPDGERPFAHPVYWSGFVLSGKP
jgi:CHAT domain-containing protein